MAFYSLQARRLGLGNQLEAKRFIHMEWKLNNLKMSRYIEIYYKWLCNLTLSSTDLCGVNILFFFSVLAYVDGS